MAKRVSYFGVMLGIALICGYIEFLIPFNFGIPGIKLGLANVVAVYMLYKNGFISALMVNTARVLLCSILFGNAIGFFYSICGGALSVAVMFLVKKMKCFSLVGVSIAGAVAHNIGQIVAAAIVLGTKAVIYYLPFLNIAGIVTGFIIGILSTYLIDRIKIK